MIKKLQKKFIMITMGSLLIIMIVLVGAINAINLYSMDEKLSASIESVEENQGMFPDSTKEDKSKVKSGIPDIRSSQNERNEIRYFVVEFNEDGTLKQIDTSHINEISSDDAQSSAEEVFASGKLSGYMGTYKYELFEHEDGYRVIFLYCSDELLMAQKVLLISCAVSFGTFLIMFLLVSVFSKRAINPIIESMEKQKLFITDAGHEIKTPLAIISANADVLELTGGENEWITSIRNQTKRLDQLVKNLLMLAKTDEEKIELSFSIIDFSKTVRKMAAPFEAVAENGNKKFALHIEEGLSMSGDQSSIEQLISTLVDNAMKYSDKGGSVQVHATTAKGKKGIKLEVYNTCDQIDTNHLDKLFDRFYRTDSSRARESGGYGIGLSIAKSIVEMHHGKISAKSEDGKSICFTTLL